MSTLESAGFIGAFRDRGTFGRPRLSVFESFAPELKKQQPATTVPPRTGQEELEPDNTKATSLVTGESFESGRPLSELFSTRKAFLGLVFLGIIVATLQ